MEFTHFIMIYEWEQCHVMAWESPVEAGEEKWALNPKKKNERESYYLFGALILLILFHSIFIFSTFLNLYKIPPIPFYFFQLS